MSSKTLRSAAIPILVFALILFLVMGRTDDKPSKDANFTAMKEQVKDDEVKEIVVDPGKNKITVTPKDTKDFKEYSVG
jgi:hypothetical protein